MKKLLIAFLGIISFFGCQKAEQSTQSQEDDLINKTAISQVINMNESEQKSAYRLLNIYEMAYLWSSKIKSFKIAEHLNKDQESFINDLLSIIKPNLFVINSESNIEFRKITGKRISANAQNLFGFENSKKLLASLSVYKSKPIITQDEGGEGELDVKKCKCATQSNYCDPIALCDEQPETVCKHTTFGCGALLLYPCDGLCRGTY